MTTEENKQLVRRWVEGGWNAGNLDLVDDLYTENYLPHWVPEGIPANREGLKQFVTMYRTAMPDLHLHIEDMVAEGDKVVWRFTATGTQTGPLFGMPPTGRQGGSEGIVIARFEGGKYAEDWVQYDLFGLLQQLGAIPTPQPATA